MITGELEGRCGKSVGVSELRRCACCRPSRPPACLCVFLSYLRFTGYEGMEERKKNTLGKPTGSTCAQNKGLFMQLLWRPTCPAGSLAWVQFSGLHSVWLSGGEPSSHCTALRTKCTKKFTLLNTFFFCFSSSPTVISTVTLDAVSGNLTNKIQVTGQQRIESAIKLASLKVAAIPSGPLSLLWPLAPSARKLMAGFSLLICIRKLG